MPRVYLLASHADSAADTPAVAGTSVLTPTVRGFRSARRAIAAVGPDILHADGPAAIRAAYLLTGIPRIGLRPRPKVVASNPEPLGDGAVGWLTRRALHSADRVLTDTAAAANRVIDLFGNRVTVIPPGAKSRSSVPVASRDALGIPADARVIVCECRFDTADAPLTAAWAFDVLKYAAPDAYLVFAGDGPARDRVAGFARGVGFDDLRVRFAESLADPLPLADVVWVTEARGVRGLFRAMAAGKPVVAIESPDVTEIAGSGARIVPAGGKIALAAATRELLADPAAAGELAAAARTRAADRLGIDGVADPLAAVYDELFRG